MDALEQEQTELNIRIETCKTAIKRAGLQASSAGVDGLDNYALEEMLVSFDPAEQNVSSLALVAAAYAQATGSDMDGDAAQAAVKDGLLNLSDAHSSSQLALARCQALRTNTKNAAAAFSMGVGTKQEWYAAMNEEALARADLCAALADFSKQANQFNRLTGGWVSRTFNWHQDTFETLFLSAVIPEEEEPEEPAEPGEDDGNESAPDDAGT